MHFSEVSLKFPDPYGREELYQLIKYESDFEGLMKKEKVLASQKYIPFDYMEKPIIRAIKQLNLHVLCFWKFHLIF